MTPAPERHAGETMSSHSGRGARLSVFQVPAREHGRRRTAMEYGFRKQLHTSPYTKGWLLKTDRGNSFDPTSLVFYWLGVARMSDSFCLEGRCPGSPAIVALPHGWLLLGGLLLGSVACGSVEDAGAVFQPGVGEAGPRPPPYLNFPPDADQAPRPDDDAPDFPRLLSQTGAFRDLARLEPSAGLIPYDLQAPLWSDGASKQRWMSLPVLGSIHVEDDGPWQVPEGTIFVKHFEMPLDEGQPAVRRRLETRLLVAARAGNFYGVTYKWNAAQTDAELVLSGATEQLAIVGSDGVEREQSYFYPGPRDCNYCHSASSGYVLGLRTRQLNHEHPYQADFHPVNQLVAWSGWGFLDRSFDNTATMLAPQLANLADQDESLEKRVRSYWDGNCSMCHAGEDGNVIGWDARFWTPMEEQGLDQPPRNAGPDLPSRLIDPGEPKRSYIFLRADTAAAPLRMPPLGRNRVDAAYVLLLQQWIESLQP
jgi:uncharacterized repeat protein (TIGR03806 family)